jgi:hypothetical protein
MKSLLISILSIIVLGFAIYAFDSAYSVSQMKTISIAPQTSIAANPPPGPLSRSTFSRASYIPSSYCVIVNANVTWVNNDTGSHTVTEKAGKFDSPIISVGNKFSHVFNEPGNYAYFDKKDPNNEGFIKVSNSVKECNSFNSQTSGELIGK